MYYIELPSMYHVVSYDGKQLVAAASFEVAAHAFQYAEWMRLTGYRVSVTLA